MSKIALAGTYYRLVMPISAYFKDKDDLYIYRKLGPFIKNDKLKRQYDQVITDGKTELWFLENDGLFWSIIKHQKNKFRFEI